MMLVFPGMSFNTPHAIRHQLYKKEDFVVSLPYLDAFVAAVDAHVWFGHSSAARETGWATTGQAMAPRA